MKPVIVIPAYQPGMELLSMLDGLARDPGQRIIVINDGSTGAARQVFDLIESRYRQIDVLHHAANLGKGEALKTGFNHFLTYYRQDCVGVVTADADGQHANDDILAVSTMLQAHTTAICLGTRSLARGVPWTSLIGNNLTRVVYRLGTGRRVTDTQSGLRGLPREFLEDIVQSSESGYDFELDMLLRAERSQREILEVPIKTIYIEANRTSHFHVIRDSLKIYFVFVRAWMVSLGTAAIDFTIFAGALWISRSIFYSLLFARLSAAAFQFSFGKYWVFKSRSRPLWEACKYAILVAILMLFSYGLIVSMVNDWGASPYVAKAVAEGVIFLLSFAGQRLFVFRPTGRASVAQVGTTDWERYYLKPAVLSPLSRAFTGRALQGLMAAQTGGQVRHICELGGANSSFFDRFRTQYPDALYTIVDNNQRGLDLFRAQHRNDDHVVLLNEDLLEQSRGPRTARGEADLVFSVGLIEHFSPDETAQLIALHFSYVRPRGIVVLTFPTPTWLYVLSRGLVELTRTWRFPDERPLSMDEVIGECSRYGEVLRSVINWPVLFTQGIVVVRAYD